MSIGCWRLATITEPRIFESWRLSANRARHRSTIARSSTIRQCRIRFRTSGEQMTRYFGFAGLADELCRRPDCDRSMPSRRATFSMKISRPPLRNSSQGLLKPPSRSNERAIDEVRYARYGALWTEIVRLPRTKIQDLLSTVVEFEVPEGFDALTLILSPANEDFGVTTSTGVVSPREVQPDAPADFADQLRSGEGTPPVTVTLSLSFFPGVKEVTAASPMMVGCALVRTMILDDQADRCIAPSTAATETLYRVPGERPSTR